MTTSLCGSLSTFSEEDEGTAGEEFRREYNDDPPDALGLIGVGVLLRQEDPGRALLRKYFLSSTTGSWKWTLWSFRSNKGATWIDFVAPIYISRNGFLIKTTNLYETWPNVPLKEQGKSFGNLRRNG